VQVLEECAESVHEEPVCRPGEVRQDPSQFLFNYSFNFYKHLVTKGYGLLVAGRMPCNLFQLQLSADFIIFPTVYFVFFGLIGDFTFWQCCGSGSGKIDPDTFLK
jgi:hypothetical protein